MAVSFTHSLNPSGIFHTSSLLALLTTPQCLVDFVSDFGFSPHDDSLLATTSFDNHIKLWRLPDVPVLTAPSAPESEFPELPRRGDALSWNPLVSSLMYVVAGNLLRLYDVRTTTKMFGEYSLCHLSVR